jgi:hypothetical protein
MAPKQRLVQNRMLANHVYTPNRSDDNDWCMAGTGTKLGSTTRSTTVPTRLTKVEKASPGSDRSIRYHKTGFASASVSAT